MSFPKKRKTPVSFGQRILIIDDDLSIREALKEVIESKGYIVDIAENGFMGGMLIEKYRPSLLILDLIMQGLDGFWVCECMRKHNYLQYTKIVVLTGFPTKDNIKKAKQSGAEKVLSKPINNDELIQVIEDLIGPASHN